MNSIAETEHLSCFGTGQTLSGKPQRVEICDACSQARPCLIRRVSALEPVEHPAAWDRFISPDIRAQSHRG
jgi:hypothetical protein